MRGIDLSASSWVLFFILKSVCVVCMDICMYLSFWEEGRLKLTKLKIHQEVGLIVVFNARSTYVYILFDTAV